MKVLLTIWILAVVIQEVVPGTLVRLPRHSLNPKSSVHTEYEAKYEQQGSQGHQSFSTVTGKQEIVHDNCGENWNAFAEKCAHLIKNLIASLATAVHSKPGDATNLQLHIKNNFKHFDSTHNCSCLSHTEKGLKDLDLSPLFKNITITSSCGSNSQLPAASESGIIAGGAPGVSPAGASAGVPIESPTASPVGTSTGNKFLGLPENSLVNPEHADPYGEGLTNNNRRQVENIPAVASGSSVASPLPSSGGIQHQTPSVSSLGSSTLVPQNVQPINSATPIQSGAGLPAIESTAGASLPETQSLPVASGNSYAPNAAEEDCETPSIGSGISGGSQIVPPLASAAPVAQHETLGSLGGGTLGEPSSVVPSAPVAQSPVTPSAVPNVPNGHVAAPTLHNTGAPEEDCEDSAALPATPITPASSNSPIGAAPIAPEVVPQESLNPVASLPQEAVAPVVSEAVPAPIPEAEECDDGPVGQTPAVLPSASQEPVAQLAPEAPTPQVNSVAPEIVSSVPQQPLGSASSGIPAQQSLAIIPSLDHKPNPGASEVVTPQQPINGVASPIVPGETISPLASGALPTPTTEEENCDEPDPTAHSPATLPAAPQSSIAPSVSGTSSIVPQQSLNPVVPETVASGVSPGAPAAVPSEVVSTASQQPINPIASETVSGVPGEEDCDDPAHASPIPAELPVVSQQPTNHIAPAPQNSLNSAVPEVPLGGPVAHSTATSLPQQPLSPLASETVSSGTHPVAPAVIPPAQESVAPTPTAAQGALSPAAPSIVPSDVHAEEDCEEPHITEAVNAVPEQPIHSETPILSQSPIPPALGQSSVSPALGQSPVSPVLGQGPVPPAIDQNPIPQPVGQSPVSTASGQAPLPPVLSQSPVSPAAGHKPISPTLSQSPVSPVLGQSPISPALGQSPLPPVFGQSPVPPALDQTPVSPALSQSSVSPTLGQGPVSPVLGQDPVSPVLSESPVSPAVGQSPIAPPLAQSPVSSIDPGFSQSPVAPAVGQSLVSPTASEPVSTIPENPVIQSPTSVAPAPPLTSANHVSEPNISVIGSEGEDCEKENEGAILPAESTGQIGSPIVPVIQNSAVPSAAEPAQGTSSLMAPNNVINPVPQIGTSTPLEDENCEKPDVNPLSPVASEISPVVKPVNPTIPAAPTVPGAANLPAGGAANGITPLESSNHLGQPNLGDPLVTSNGNTPVAGNIPAASVAPAPLETNGAQPGYISPETHLQATNPPNAVQSHSVFPTAPSVPADSLEDDEVLRPTTYQTTSVEPTRPQNPPILTIPLSHTESPLSEEEAVPCKPSTQPHLYQEVEDEDEDCCDCESCTEEITNPNEYRANACKDLEDARRELKAIFDKIKKRLKCGRRFKPIPTTATTVVA